jgi:sugar phosphate isomerase/epimerase
MDVGCNTYSLSRLPRQAVFTELRALGFSLVELWTGHASYLKGDVDPAAVAAEARAAGLGIRAYCIGGLFGLPLPLVEERLRGAFQFARALGVDLVTGIVDRSAVGAADAACQRYGMGFAIENHWYAEFARPADYRAALRSVSPAVGVNIDTGHFAFLGCDLEEAARALGARTMNVHLKVVKRPGRLEVLRRRFQRRYRMEPALPRPGDGLDGFVAALADAGYHGMLAVEHESPSAEADLAVYHARACELVGRRVGRLELVQGEAHA